MICHNLGHANFSTFKPQGQTLLLSEKGKVRRVQYNANRVFSTKTSSLQLDLQIHGLKTTHTIFSEIDGIEKGEYINPTTFYHVTKPLSCILYTHKRRVNV